MVIENRELGEPGRSLGKLRGFSNTIVCESLSEHVSSGRSLAFAPLPSEPQDDLQRLFLTLSQSNPPSEGVQADESGPVAGLPDQVAYQGDRAEVGVGYIKA